MVEYILWGTDNTGFERPISEQVFDKNENERRKNIAIQNGWKNVRTQTIDWGNQNGEKELANNFIKSIKI